MTETTWKIVQIAISKLENSPAWLSDLAQRSREEIGRLPVLDDAVEGQMALPLSEEKVVTPGYLDFLREQIRLNARGPSWTCVLQKRLDALGPFVGKPLLTVTFFQKPSSATLRINQDTGQLIYFELY